MLHIFIHEADKQSRPSIDHYFRKCCLSVCPSVPTFLKPRKAKQSSQERIVIATGRTLGLAEWFIDNID